MLAEFGADLRADLADAVKELKTELRSIGERTDHLEGKMSEMVTAHNSIEDTTHALEEEVAGLKSKLVDQQAQQFVLSGHTRGH